MRPLLDCTSDELRDWFTSRGQPPMRARQVRRWLLAGRAESFEHMTDLPLGLRQELAVEFVPFGSSIERHQQSSDGTHKLLLRLSDDRLVECVLIPEDDRRTACISTQVGCGMGCVFCASGLNGVERNLTICEMIEQLIRLRNLLSLPSPPASGGEGSEVREVVRPPPPHPQPLSPKTGESWEDKPARLSNIVVMGMGEPLANLERLLEALDVATAPDGLGIGARHVTISTVGLPAKMRQLADLKKQYHLAVSLHASNDGLRTQIVPTNDKMGLDAILAAADYFHAQTGRQVTYEYVLLRELNDRLQHAEELARLLLGRQAHVNLIPFNDVEGLPYRRPLPATVNEFVAVLRRRGITVHVRKRKGADIDAACGQLRRTIELASRERQRPELISLSANSGC